MKNSLQTFPIADYAISPLEPTFLSSIKNHSSWLLPQIMALLGSVVQIQRNEKHLIDPATTLAETITLAKTGNLEFNGQIITREILRGAFNICNHFPRSDILKGKMTVSPNIRYNSGVPLILSALKEYKNIQYMEWDWSHFGMSHFVDSGIFELVPFMFVESEWDNETLIKYRALGNTKNVDYASMYNLFSIPDREFNKLPRLMKLMLCQVWCYHPTIRHKYMITNLMDLDQTTEPLVTSEIFEKTEANPWDV